MMTATLKTHDRALRKALVAAHGYLSATEGDSWFYRCGDVRASRHALLVGDRLAA